MADDLMTEVEMRGLGLSSGARHYRAYVGRPERYDLMAALQFRLLTELGLRDVHNLLEIGCGSLRFGRLLLAYLLPDRYVGVEPEEWLVKDGIRHELGEAIVPTKRPLFCFDGECDLRHFGRSFDFVVIQSVVTHAPLDWIERCAKRLAGVLAQPGGLVVGSHFEAGQDYTGKEWVYPGAARYRRETFVETFAAEGLTFRTLDEISHPAGAKWFTLSHAG